MSKKICLTPKQELYLNVIKSYHKAHGSFPNNTQLVQAVREAGGVAGATGATQMYATLFLKGAFTGGVVLTDSMAVLHSGGNITPLDVSALQFTPRAIKRGRKAGGKNAPKVATQTPQTTLASAILTLLSESPEFKAALANIAQVSG
jgi:hypothetical protein